MFGLDKYTDTVLLAYVVSIALLAGLVWISLAKSKRMKRELHAQETRSNDKH